MKDVAGQEVLGSVHKKAERGIPESAIRAQFGHLLGKILTIVDASYTDVTQREAVKSLIREKVYDQLNWLLGDFPRKADFDGAIEQEQ